jgi:hypothetical protein
MNYLLKYIVSRGRKALLWYAYYSSFDRVGEDNLWKNMYLLYPTGKEW